MHFFNRIGLCRSSDFTPHGDSVSPPELAGDAPVAFLGEPVDVAFGVAIGSDADAVGGDGVDGGLGEAGSADTVCEGHSAFEPWASALI